MPLNPSDLGSICCAFALAVVFTPLVRSAARRYGAVAQPRADRWHSRPTALLGGIAIFAAVTLTLVAFRLIPSSVPGWIVGSTLMFGLGLWDDLRRILPSVKLLGQIAAAAFVLVSGGRLMWIENPVLDMALTMFWLVGITNAMNLIDNMDGLAAGVGAIAAVFFAIHLHGSDAATRQLVLAAALLGFLVYNFNPASIFMGDSGSQFIGFFLANAAVQIAGEKPETHALGIVTPLLVLAVPIIDTTFVTITRILSGRQIWHGGRDHTSHRLAAIGIAERTVAFLIWQVASLCGVLSL